MYFLLFIYLCTADRQFWVTSKFTLWDRRNAGCSWGKLKKQLTNSTKLFARFEMVANSSTVTHCQHLPILLNCQRNISLKSRFKSPTVAFTKGLQNNNPKTHRARFSWLIFVCLGKQKGFTEVCPSVAAAQLMWRLPGTIVIRMVVELSVQGFHSDSPTIAW